MVRPNGDAVEIPEARGGLSLRLRILASFSALAMITLILGGFAMRSVERSGGIVVEIFDHALIATSYARSAAGNFAALDAAFAHGRRESAGPPGALPARFAELAALVTADLDIAAARATSDSARRVVARARLAVESWITEAQMRAAPAEPDWPRLLALAEAAQEDLDILVNLVAGDAFRQRQRARAAIQDTGYRTAFGTLAAFLASGAIALLLARRVIGPVAAASIAAAQIAAGQLDTPVPAGGRDELGVLLRAMERMRDAIRATIEGEQAERRSAQRRLVDAMEGSTEGVVLSDAAGRIVAVNARTADLMPAAASLLAEGKDWLCALAAGLGRCSSEAALAAPPPKVIELQRPDAGWLRLSSSPGRDGGAVAILSDISELKAQEAALAEAHGRIAAALGTMSQGLCMVDSEQRVLVCNARFAEMFGLPDPAGLTGMPVGTLFAAMIASGTFPAHFLSAIVAEQQALALAGGRASFQRQGVGGEALAVAQVPMDRGGWLATYEDLTEKCRAEERIAFLAQHDLLTGLPNRILFRDRAEQAVAELGRDRGFALLCLDIDDFKAVNDVLGHAVGDDVLREVATRLAACCREGDTVARLGGDEFAIIQAGAATSEQVAILGERIRQAMRAPFMPGGEPLEIGVSLGVALAPHDGAQPDRLLRCADTALYRAKQDGRGLLRFFEPEMDARQQARRALEHDLRRAVSAEELDLFYQPLINLAAGTVCGFEALLRWRHPERGMISPADFIPVAEEMGLIIPIGEWALRRACHDARGWPGEIRVAVNVSPVQFKSPRLVAAVEAALHESGLPASRLELEITESVMLVDSAATMSTLHQLHGLGVRIAMDDFGTGYSSLGYLRSFPFDKIKIDQSFIRDLSKPGGRRGDGAAAVVKAIIGLGRSLQMRTTAEGVETAAQLGLLSAEGCTEAQGYFFGRPTPAVEVAAAILQINQLIRPSATA